MTATGAAVVPVYKFNVDADMGYFNNSNIDTSATSPSYLHLPFIECFLNVNILEPDGWLDISKSKNKWLSGNKKTTAAGFKRSLYYTYMNPSVCRALQKYDMLSDTINTFNAAAPQLADSVYLGDPDDDAGGLNKKQMSWTNYEIGNSDVLGYTNITTPPNWWKPTLTPGGLPPPIMTFNGSLLNTGMTMAFLIEKSASDLVTQKILLRQVTIPTPGDTVPMAVDLREVPGMFDTSFFSQ
jgi:hypothetical protein